MKSIDALITADVLIWAREESGCSPDVVSDKVGIESEELRKWENGSGLPSIAQLRKLAAVYKRPFSCFYLPVRPIVARPPRDLRRIDHGATIQSVASLNLAIRSAQLYRENVIELNGRMRRVLPEFKIKGIADITAHELARHLRQQLKVNFAEQSSWHDNRVGFNYWRNLLERHGILVYQFGDVASADARGFSLFHESLPVIAVNSHESPAGRTFTLFHELAHLVERQSGVCDIHDDYERHPAAQRIEVFCNAVAGNFLVPDVNFREAIVDRKFSLGNLDLGLSRLAKTFSVSRFVILRRLLDCSVIPKPFYEEHYERLLREYRQSQDLKKKKQAAKEMRISVANNVISSLGLRYVGMVLQQYRGESISVKAAAEYINAKPKHLDRVEHLFQTRLLNRGGPE